MSSLAPEGQFAVAQVAQRHGVSADAAAALLGALANGGGSMAQFNIPELGGLGQWAQGGMIMVGDMFNNALRARVDALCQELAALLRGPAPLFAAPIQSSANWWPAELGSPSSTGAQNDMRYAYFPAARRLAVQRGGQVAVYGTGEHSIGGFSQQQGGDQSATFSSQFGQFRVDSLPLVSGNPPIAPPSPAPAQAPVAPSGAQSGGDPIALLQQLAELHSRGVLSDAEFGAKKAELLSRI